MNYKIILYTFALSILLFSCSPSVRFSSNTSHRVDNSITSFEKKNNYDKLSQNERKEKVVMIAEQWLGTPYLFGGNSIDGIDCSALIQNIYNELGLSVPRTAQEQFDYTEKVNKNGKTAGDLVFFKKDVGISHVGIYVGNNEIIHASTSRGVVRESLDTIWLEKIFAGIGRVSK